MLDTEKTYIIAELSANHIQKIDIARKTIVAMKEAGADAVKLQTFTPDTMTMDSDKPWFQTRKDSLWAGQKLFDLYKKAQTPWEWHEELKNLSNKLGLDFFSSPFDPEAVRFLESLDVPAYKIASPEITDIPLIEEVAKTGKFIIISTGVANEKDIELAVETVRSEGNNQIALLKCTSAYPAPFDEINLRAIPLLKRRYQVIPGLSDHTLGIAVPVAAVALGARIIEKHFILDRNLPGLDRAFSLMPDEFKLMVDSVRQVEKALGEETLNLTESAEKARQSLRSLFVTKDLNKGDVLSEDNVRSLRPGNGMHPRFYDNVIGKKVNKKIEKGTPLASDMIE